MLEHPSNLTSVSKEITTSQTVTLTPKSAIKSLKYFSSISPRAILQLNLLLLFVDSCLICVFLILLSHIQENIRDDR